MFGEKSKSVFEVLPAKTAFFAGLIAGVLAVGTIGFILFLAGVLGNKEPAPAINNQNVNQAAANQPNDQGSAKNLKKITKDDHIRGKISAPVMLVEFSDFQCPFCQRVNPTLQKLMDDYQGKVAWVYKHFPLDSLHPFARTAAEASECAAEQGKFWEYADKLYENQQSFSQDYFPKLAGELNLDTEKFTSCLSSGKYKDRVNANQQEGLDAGITGTPGIYINDQLVKGALPYENFKQIIDSILGK